MATWIAIITAVATVMNAVAVVVLVVVTIFYAKSAHRQAEATEAQAKAASEQASAAGSQARAAFATLNALKQQIHAQTLVAQSVVENAISSTLSNIEECRRPVMGKPLEVAIRSRSFPPTLKLLPPNYGEVLECARRLSSQFASQLNNGFDCLIKAAAKIDGMNAADRNWLKPDDLSVGSKEVLMLLQEAESTLQRCRTDVYNTRIEEV